MSTPTTVEQVIQVAHSHFPEAQHDTRAPWHASIPSDAAQRLLAHLIASPHFTIDQAENDGTWEATDRAGHSVSHVQGRLRHWPTT